MSKVKDVYQALKSLSDANGHIKSTQSNIAKLAGLSTRHLRRITTELEEMGLLRAVPRHNRKGYRSGMIYFVPCLPDIESPIGQPPTGHGESFRPSLPDMGSPLGEPTGHQESDRTTHDMMNDDDLKRERWDLLNFFDEPSRSYRAANCNLEQARAWRRFYDYAEMHDLWSEFGVRSNPIGWIYKLMDNGQEPPPIQIPLPGAAVDLSEQFKSRGKSRADIETDHPLGAAGATLGDDGIWR